MTHLCPRLQLPVAALVGAALLLTGCPVSDDDDDGGGIDLQGTVVDPYLDDAGVSDAWIIVDTGDELMSTRSANDGSFVLPELPRDEPIVLTVAGSERRASTYLDMVLAEQELPLQLSCSYREATYYDAPMMVVSGTFTGAPVGTWVIFSGEGMLQYDYFYAESSSPTEFQFEAQLDPGTEEYFFTAMAFDGETGEPRAAGAVTVEVAPQVDVEMELAYDETVSMTVSASQPRLDGEPLTTLDPTYTSSLGMVYVGKGYGSFVGWTLGWEATDDGFELDVRTAVMDDQQPRIALYLSEDLTARRAFSYAMVPIEPGATELEVDVLDSPLLEGDDTFEPGATVSWAPVDGADSNTLYVMDGDAPTWWLFAGEPTFPFPRFPDGFDSSMLFEDGTWTARSYHRTLVDGELDTTQPYLVSESPGGDAAH